MQNVLEFVKNYFIFMLILFLVSYLVPKEEYRKYFNFFIAALMVAILMQPVLSFLNRDAAEKLRDELSSIEEELSVIEYYEKGENIFEQFLTDQGMADAQDAETE